MSKLAEQYTDLDKLRHSCSHVLAQAVKRKYPQAKLGYGNKGVGLNARTTCDTTHLQLLTGV